MNTKCCTKIISVLIAALLTAGCTFSGDYPINSPDSTESSVQNTETTAVSDLAEAPEPVSLDHISVPFGNTTLRTLDLDYNMLYPISDTSDDLLLTSMYNDDNLTAQLTDLRTGETHSVELSNDDEWSPMYGLFVINGIPLAVNYSNGTVTVYDRELNVLHTEELGFSSYSGVQFENSVIIPDYTSGNSLIIMQVAPDGSITSRSINITLGSGMELSQALGAVCEGEYLISYFSNENYSMYYGILCEDTSDIIQLHTEDTEVVSAAGGNLTFTNYSSSETYIFDPDNPDIKKVFEVPAGTSYIASHGNHIYFYSTSPSDESGILRLTLSRYDTESGKLTAKLETDVSAEYLYMYNAYEYGDYVLLDTYADDDCKILVWQPDDAPQMRGYNAVTGVDYTEANSSLAEKIKDKYSIEVFYGNEGVRHFTDYAVVSETDEKLINSSLTLLDGFMAKFPEGFFEELIGKSAGYNEMCIYLTGQIIPNKNESQSISDASAFVFTEDNCQIMVLDITQSYALEKTAAHEFMHIIENAIYCMDYDEDGNLVDKESFIRWDMLNPADFSYYYSYTDEYGTTLGYDAVDYNGAMYYDGCGMDINTLYFVDGYSMTYPSEDRARIFENIATSSAEMLPSYFKGSAMQLKAAYLCACIRDSFDCITDDTVLFWESGINSDYTLDYFRDNYDVDAFLAETAVG